MDARDAVAAHEFVGAVHTAEEGRFALDLPAAVERLVGVDDLPGVEQLEGLAEADQARQALRRAAARLGSVALSWHHQA